MRCSSHISTSLLVVCKFMHASILFESSKLQLLITGKTSTMRIVMNSPTGGVAFVELSNLLSAICVVVELSIHQIQICDCVVVELGAKKKKAGIAGQQSEDVTNAKALANVNLVGSALLMKMEGS